MLRQIAFARVRLTWVTAGYGWVALVFPIVVAAPGYFAGRLSFGELMMVVGAFNQVQQSLRWFVDNTSAIADWRATLLRVMNFRQALLDLDAVEAGAGLIERREDPQGRFTLDAVRVETRHGCIALDPPRLEVGPGERVLILGKPGSGRTSFFLAIAGLWSAGSGRIGVPPDAEVAYLTQRPFLPSGSLRAALTSDGAAHERRRAARRAGARRPRRPRRRPRHRRPLGPRPRPRGAGAAGLRAAAARPAEVADLRRGPGPAGRSQPADSPVDPGGRARGERGRQHLAAPGADRLLRQGGGAHRIPAGRDAGGTRPLTRAQARLTWRRAHA